MLDDWLTTDFWRVDDGGRPEKGVQGKAKLVHGYGSSAGIVQDEAESDFTRVGKYRTPTEWLCDTKMLVSFITSYYHFQQVSIPLFRTPYNAKLYGMPVVSTPPCKCKNNSC
jgi:hypothetical protein